jgi:hypothetical protein
LASEIGYFRRRKVNSMSQKSSRRRRPPQEPAVLIDSTAVRADLAAIAKKQAGDESALRIALAARNKIAMQ